MNIIQRFQKAVKAFNSSVDMEQVSKQLNAMIASGDLPVGDATEKQSTHDSKLSVRSNDTNLAYAGLYYGMRSWLGRTNDVLKKYQYDDPSRDIALSEVWMREPLLAGTIYSMCAKFSALKWTMTGKRLPARRAADILSEAAHMDGWGWGPYIASVANDFYACNRGTFTETAKEGDPAYGALNSIGHIDALACTLTGNKKTPMWYLSDTTGQSLPFRPGEYFHFASMPSPRERYLGIGLCAVDRALRAVKILMAVHDYDEEKLNNLPPEGVASVTGLTMEEFQDALQLWQAARKQNNSLTFPQVLWLIGSQPNAQVSVNITGFSNLPESFDRKTVVDQYACTLALCFGIDVREIWTMASGGGLGTAGESEIQHMKAKGKGPGEFITNMERCINGELPEGVDFAFDTQDIEEDANAAAVAKAWIDAYFPLYNLPPAGQKSAEGVTNPRPENAVAKANPNPDKPNGQPTLPTSPIPGVNTGADMTNGGGQPNQPKNAEQLLSKKDFMRLLVDKGVLPDWMISDERTMITDTGHHVGKEYGDDAARFVWDSRGIIKEERLYLGNIQSDVLEFVPEAEVQKGGSGSGNFNHEGRPGEVGGSDTSHGVYKDSRGTKIYKISVGRNLPDDLVSTLKKVDGGEVRVAYNTVSGNWHISSKSLDNSDHGDFVNESLDGETPEYSESIMVRGTYNVNTNELLIYDFLSEVGNIADNPIAEKKLTRDINNAQRKVLKSYFYLNGRKPKFEFEDFAKIAGYKEFADIDSVEKALQFLHEKEIAIQDLEAKRNIKGNPIPATEAKRGNRVTSKTIRDELSRWRENPILAKYALTPDEEAALLKLEPGK